jgi:hypothetical protein
MLKLSLYIFFLVLCDSFDSPRSPFASISHDIDEQEEKALRARERDAAAVANASDECAKLLAQIESIQACRRFGWVVVRSLFVFVWPAAYFFVFVVVQPLICFQTELVAAERSVTQVRPSFCLGLRRNALRPTLRSTRRHSINVRLRSLRFLDCIRSLVSEFSSLADFGYFHQGLSTAPPERVCSSVSVLSVESSVK